ncbi:MAG: adenylate/guanylate cyclase domain-containing protein [Rhizobiaceae bacterium]|nr:adenylate/guanylate cyclase domain-containing protein [Rhizobiaceae bacterium]
MGPLRVHLSVVIVLLLLATSLPLIWLSYQQGRRLAIESATTKMQLLSRHAIDHYRNVYGHGYVAVSMAAALDTFELPPPAELGNKRDFLVRVLSVSRYLDSIYAGYPDGSFVQAVSLETNPRWGEVLAAPDGAAFALRTIEREAGRSIAKWTFLDDSDHVMSERVDDKSTFDPTRREWYNAAHAAPENEAIAVGPYTTATTGALTLTIAQRNHYANDVVLGADLLLETMSRLLAENAASEHTVGFVFDERHRLIAHSNAAMMKQIMQGLESSRHVASPSINDPVLAKVQELLEHHDPTNSTENTEVEGRRYLFEISAIDSTDLVDGTTVVMAAPLSDFTAESRQLVVRALAISAALLLLGVIAALVVSRLITRSLQTLTGAARDIGDLETDRSMAMASHITEIATLASTLETARHALQTFALYVPRELVRRVVASGQASEDASRLEVTVLFSDIRDFTTISEANPPEHVVALLSDYFEMMNRIVERQNGVIVQYLGDSIYAMWNAPTTNPRHVSDACRCALALKQGVDELNRANRAAGRPELVTRFGLHTGVAVVGNVGARKRLQYTAMGDTVNVASRLEGLNKSYGTTILVSRAIVDRAEPGFSFRPLGSAHAKGRHEEIEVFELGGLSSHPDTPAASS